MRTLIFFFWNRRFFTLFIILETVSVLLLVNSYSYQRSLTLNAVNDVTGNLFKISSDVTGYLSLKKQNFSLVEENARLRNRLSSSLFAPSSDSLRTDSLFAYTPATVVSNTVNRRNNYLMVDKGRVDGIEKEMAAISGNGLVGVVIGVSPHFSLIMSMLNENTVISARIKKNNQLVSVTWSTDNYLFGTVNDIPSNGVLQKGDTIVTSGNSLIFPPDVPIGIIHQYRIDSLKSLNNAILRFSTDFNSLHTVYLIKNSDRKEQQILNQSRL